MRSVNIFANIPTLWGITSIQPSIQTRHQLSNSACLAGDWRQPQAVLGTQHRWTGHTGAGKHHGGQARLGDTMHLHSMQLHGITESCLTTMKERCLWACCTGATALKQLNSQRTCSLVGDTAR